MDFINSNSNNDYTKLINSSSYEQKISSKIFNNKSSKYCNSLLDIFLSNFDPSYVLMDMKDRKNYIKKKAISIASELDENKIEKYDKFHYNSGMKSNIIQTGLQLDNNTSTLLYLSDYYNVSTLIYLYDSKKYVKTSDKIRTNFRIIYKQNKWYTMDDTPTDFEETIFGELSCCLHMDVATKDIYTKYLKGIGNYKVNDLYNIANELDISVSDSSNKKKTKKVLYDEINLYKLNHP